MKTIQKMYDHLHWANQRILEALESSKDEEVIRLFSHILFAEKVWLTRLQGVDSSHLPIWSDIGLEGCAELVKQNEEGLTTFLKEANLDKIICYKNSKGTQFENSVRDVLTHVALHGQYHRGQINSRLRASGSEPVNVDFITFVR
ncbi:DinB family protein [Lysinibacillus antri]|uniref:Damage-inducible protein DinB n=1 Tax=Lysinibacillus antri TaxID=2498145 RepID=A0A3S0P307_9BACI|nr:DinB family protein [Lysinibacillus antri]RUL50468.1 damage-inducible protein DinB [Lysinibacillus antri]